MITPCNHLAAAFLFVVFTLPFAASASPDFSPIITVDTRGSGNLTVTGRVLNGQNNTPLSGVAISLSGQNTTTTTNGSFILANVDLAAGVSLTTSAAGFVSQTRSVVAAADQKAVNVGDIFLAATTGLPVVELVKPDVDGIFLAGFGLIPTLTATVNWNGNTPSQVEFRVNGSVYATRNGAGPEYSVVVPVDSALRTALSATGNVISVTATAQEAGKVSDPFELTMAVVPVPAALQSGTKSSEGWNLKVKFFWPPTKPFGSINLPVLGSMGGEASGAGELNYNFRTGAWTVEAGRKYEGESTQYSAFKLKLGPMEDIKAEIKGKASGTATAAGGIDLSEFEIISALSLGGKFPIGSYSPIGLLGPGLTAKVVETPVLNEAFRAMSVILWLKPELAGQLAFQAYPTLDFKDLTLTGKTALEAAYEPTLGKVKAKFYVGGEPSVKFGLPGDFFREMRFKAYAGLEAKLWILKTDLRYVFVDVSYPAGALNPAAAFGEGSQVLAAAENATAAWQVMPRPWRDTGGEVFLPQENGTVAARSESAAPQAVATSGLEAFVHMGQSSGSGVSNVAGKVAAMIIPNDPAALVQAEFPLLDNVFPESEPALAGKGNELMLAYVRDTGAANPVQFTEVAFSYFNGTTWTVPAPVGPSSSVVMSEGFNGMSIPTGWAVDKPGALDVFFVTSSSNPAGLVPAEGSHMVRVNSFDVSSGTVRLRKTESFSTVGLTGATVDFDWSVDSGYPASNDRVSVEWSPDGTNWTSMGEVSRYASSGAAWTEQSFSLPPAAIGLPQVYVSFLFTTEYGNDCHLDNLRVSLNSPAPQDPRGQFSPQVVFDGAGNAVAVFERIKDGAFAGTVMADMAALMEIVWSHWDAATQTWSVPQALTDNAFLDFNAKLSGPLTDGDLLLTWNQNEANQIDGTGIAGAVTNLRVMTLRWDSTAQTWGTAAVLVPNLTGELSESLGAGGNKGVYLWSVDMDGNTDDSSDAELYYRLYDATTDTWSPAVRHTTDAVVDHHGKAVVDAAGNVYSVWNRDGDLVMDVNFAGAPSVVRSGAGTLGVADFALTIGPAGNLALIWQEMTENGSDAHYRVYDPASSTWGKDALLSEDSDLERSFAPLWDAAGNLTLAYGNVTITKQTVNVDVDGGGTVQVDGVPQPGQVDLMLAKRALVKDLAAVPEGLTADGTTFLPGDALVLKASVKNAGNLAVQDVQVAFYDGDPANGGTLIGTETISGWLEAMDEAEVSVNWTVPQPAQARTIYMQIDPSAAVSESDETNNTLALPINGVDLALEYQEGSVLRDGSVRVVVKVRNLSAPESPVTMLRLKAQVGGAILAETTVSQLAPGQSVDVPFDLPAGTQPEGDGAYLLIVDEENFSSDIDTDNNEAPFALNLWIDDDGDGIPHWWEQANGMSDSNKSDALQDVDRDGFDALAEYLSGTNPRNPASRLGVGQFNVITNNSTGEATSTVSWASVAGRLYRVERSFDLVAWQTVADNVEPLPPLNTLTDTTTPPSGRVFYRVVVK